MNQSKFVSLCQRVFGTRGVEIAIGMMQIKWLNFIDSVITLMCVFGVVWVTRSMIAFLLLISFGLWNYWRGLSEGYRQAAKLAAAKDVAITQSMIDRVKRIPPGGAIRCVCERDKVEFIVIEASDFDHIADLAGLVAKTEGKNDEDGR